MHVLCSLHPSAVSWGHWQCAEAESHLVRHCKGACRCPLTLPFSSPLGRIANSNNMNKSESDQEDNDDINDNDWSYGSEKKGVLGSGEAWEKLGCSRKVVVE